jgi:hypothetical protein
VTVRRQDNRPVASRRGSSASVREDPVEDPFVDSPTRERVTSFASRGSTSAEDLVCRRGAFSTGFSGFGPLDALESSHQSQRDLLCSPRPGSNHREVSGTRLDWGLPM